jgi:protein-tyrosine phosphatase
MTQARMNRGAERAPPPRIPPFLLDPVWVRSRFGGYRGLARLMLAWGELMIGRHRRWKGVRWENVTRIVFVCHGNICRSPYAERRAVSHGLATASFGLSAECGAPADPVAISIATQRGIPLAEHKARDLKEFDFRSGDLLVAMEPRQVRAMSAALPPVPCQLTLLGLWSRPSRPHIHDPHRLSEAYWGRCFDVIDSAVLTIADRMRRAAR